MKWHLDSLCFLLCLPSRHFVIELAAANHLSSKQDQLPNSSNDRGLSASNINSCLLLVVDIHGICVDQIDLDYDQNYNEFFFLLILLPQPTKCWDYKLVSLHLAPKLSDLLIYLLKIKILNAHCTY